MLATYHVVQVGGEWQVLSQFLKRRESLIGAHKSEAIEAASALAREAPPSRIVVHNEDGTLDFLEHGHGIPPDLAPHGLASASGSTFQKVDDSIASILSRGAEAVIRSGNSER